MASKIREGNSVYIPFINGESVQDSQLRPRMYGSEEQFKAKYPGFRLDKPKLVEYAPVVRCKDCKYFEVDDGHKYGVLCVQHGHRFSVPKPDDYCSYGERRYEADD